MGSTGRLGSAGALAGILLDMDGVVVHQRLDFPAIKREIWGDTEGYILERMATLSGEALARAEAILDRHETAAAMEATAMDGALPFLAWMEARGLRRGLVTRNSAKSVQIVLERLGLRFDAVVTREDAPPKPAPDPVLLACRRIGLQPSEVLFVGDFEFDMLAGRRAGTGTVLLCAGTQRSSEHADLTVDSLTDLRRAIEEQLGGRGAAAPR